MDSDFITQDPENDKLKKIVDYYFYLDIPLNDLTIKEEQIIPFPRITFGYFFNAPFKITNHTLGEEAQAEIIFSRLSSDTISVQPLTDKIKILGAHLKPYALSYFIEDAIADQPWIVDLNTHFDQTLLNFKTKVESLNSHSELFQCMESFFMENLIDNKAELISEVVDIIEQESGSISIEELAVRIGVSSRTLRTHFRASMGCSPKEYLKLVKLKQAIFQMKNSNDSLTAVSYDQDYADQAHFSHALKKLTGESPKNMRKKMSDFRFLQF